MSTALIDDLGDRDWEVLLRAIDRGNCVLLLGQDQDVATAEGGKRNLSVDLAQHLARILADENQIELAEPWNLPLVAQAFQHAQNSRDYLEIEVQRFFDDYTATLPSLSDEAFDSIAALPFRMIVTSRHDDTLAHMMARAEYHGQAKAPRTEIYEFNGDRRENLRFLGSPEEPLIYKLFGAPDVPESLVITENDRLEFLESVVRGQPKLPTDLTNHFMGKNFLFIGFGLPNYHLRVLMHVLGMGRSGPSFALEKLAAAGAGDDRAETFEESVVFYQVAGYSKLRLMDTDPDRFLAELRRRWEAQASDARPAAATNGTGHAAKPAEGRPKVFISYSMEDVDRARHLAEIFGEYELEAWWDKTHLEVGERYDHALEDAISSEVDYFVVLQSRAINDRLESYVHKEVRLALARAEKRVVPFIFPAVIDEDAERLTALDRERLQAFKIRDMAADGPILARKIIEVARENARAERR